MSAAAASVKAALGNGGARTDALYDRALRSIVEGGLPPGARITERWLTETCGTTHAQAREMLHRLDKTGAVILSPRRGAVVVDNTVADPMEVRPVWLALLSFAVDRAAAHEGAAPPSPTAASRSGRWVDFMHLMDALARICAMAGIDRLTQALTRIALQTVIAADGSSAIDAAAIAGLAEAVQHGRLDAVPSLIAVSFAAVTIKGDDKRDAGQIAGRAPSPVIDAGITAGSLRAYLDRIHMRIDRPVAIPQSATEHLAAVVLQRIQFGVLRPDAPIRELPLAAEFGLSRGPVRDALRALDRRGVIRVEGRRGAFVRSQDATTVTDLFALRSILSGVQMASAAGSERPAWIDEQLQEGAALLLAIADDADSPFENYIVARRALASVTLAAANNAYLGRLAMDLESEVSVLWATVTSKARQHESATTWRAIVEAILGNDPAAARREGMRIVIDAGTEAVRAALRRPDG